MQMYLERVRANLGACTLVEQICAIGTALRNALKWTTKESDVSGGPYMLMHVTSCLLVLTFLIEHVGFLTKLLRDK
jgi:hypothetical protein